jgi:hypothetical protein
VTSDQNRIPVTSYGTPPPASTAERAKPTGERHGQAPTAVPESGPGADSFRACVLYTAGPEGYHARIRLTQGSHVVEPLPALMEHMSRLTLESALGLRQALEKVARSRPAWYEVESTEAPWRLGGGMERTHRAERCARDNLRRYQHGAAVAHPN